MQHPDYILTTMIGTTGRLIARIQYGNAFPVVHVKSDTSLFDLKIDGLMSDDIPKLCDYLMVLKQELERLHQDAVSK